MKSYQWIFLVFSIVFLTGCNQTVTSHEDEDYYGRVIEIEETVERVICIGPNALRLYSYIGPVEKVVGIEQFEIDRMGYDRPYSMLYQAHEDLKIIGLGGPQGALDYEAIIAAKPDVIFISNHFDLSSIDDLQRRTKTPVVTLTMDTADGNVFNEDLYASFKLIGTVIDEQTRALEVIEYFKRVEQDIKKRVETMSDEIDVYLGSLSRGGAQGIFSTTGTYDGFDRLKLKNTAALNGIKGHAFIDAETLISFEPKAIVLDVMGIQPTLDYIATRPEYFQYIKAFNEGLVFVQMPYNFYATNLEIALVNHYYIGKSLYPEAFSDVCIKTTMNETSTFLLGFELYDALKRVHPMGYEPLKIND